MLQLPQNSGVIQSGQRVIVSQPTLLSVSQPMTMVKATLTQVLHGFVHSHVTFVARLVVEVYLLVHA